MDFAWNNKIWHPFKLSVVKFLVFRNCFVHEESRIFIAALEIKENMQEVI